MLRPLLILRSTNIKLSCKLSIYVIKIYSTVHSCNRIGSPGTFTQGHLDSKDNFAYQIIGEKRWTIFSPQDYKYLYYKEAKGSLEWSAVLSSLDPPTLTQYPLFSKATPITFTMKAGEVLYLPRGWTHRVENVTPALMINTWRYGPAAVTEHWSAKNRDELRTKCF